MCSGFASKNGPVWLEQRRATMKAMKDIGLGRTRWEELVQEEVNDLVKLMQEEPGRPVDMSEFFASTFANNIMTLVLGTRLPLGHPSTVAVSQFVDLTMRSFTQVAVGTFFPWLIKLLGKFGAYKDSIPVKKLTEFNQLIMNRSEKESEDNYIDKYYNEIKLNMKNKMKTSFTESHLRGNTQILLIGGTETSRTSLIYLLMAMAQFPEIQKKVHEELDQVLGKDGCIKWADRGKVPYTYAVLMSSRAEPPCQSCLASQVSKSQSVRLLVVGSPEFVLTNHGRFPAYFNRFHLQNNDKCLICDRVSEDIKIHGYDIPKGSYIIANDWFLHNNPKYWSEPEKFIPERFLLDDGTQVNYKPDSYNPFSYGKRNCPGEMVALITLLHYFTTIMQKFSVLPERDKVEYGTILGLTHQPTDVKLRFIPRD
ncbi:cytochrome P450 2J5-like [Stegodyphus dumicola]|uniref:cytochrome P450 2J5-like n=1 Tax=Stegodyphus dumicola TaxID=202533 RepID=UPI0015B2162D|nr:cytochrome P450 2J5-like [Stegodyphus dumicola]